MKNKFSFLAALGGAAMFLLVCLWHVRDAQPTLASAEKTSFGSREDPHARLRYEWMMLRDPATNEIPRGIRQRELEFARRLPSKESQSALNKGQAATWVSRGPWNVGGRTRALGIDVSNPNVIIAGGVSGGMWRSADGGATWSKQTAPGSLHSVTCLAQDRRTGQTATWYYGTGEFLGNSATGGTAAASYRGDGMFKSVDNGLTWTVLSATANGNPQAFTSHWDFVWNVVVHPTTGHVYAATYNAIMRSQDGGTTWTRVLGGGNTGPYSAMTDIQISPTGILYATGSFTTGSAMNGVWRSADGATWTNINPSFLPATYNRIVIGIAPSSPTNVYFVAETPGTGTNNHSFWKFTDGGSWENRSANIPAFGGAVGDFDSQGSYDLVISVKPDDPNLVLIGGTNLYRSTNGFTTTAATTWIGGYSTANDVSLYANHHPDQHALVWAPNNPAVLYSGHDGGVSRSTNILATPHVWQPQSPGYLTTQFYTVALDRATSGSNTIIGGMQDNGTWKTTSSSPTATWTSLFGGDGAFTAIANGGGSEYVSAQNGQTYRLFGTQFARVDPAGGSGYLFINPFVLDRNNSNIMYFAGGEYVWRNSDLTGIPPGSTSPPTTNWTRLDATRIAGSTVTALGVSTTNPANRLYVGWADGNLLRVDNANTAGYTVTNVGAAIPTGYIHCVAVDPTNGNRALAVFTNYNLQSLWFTTDGGATWTDVEGNLAGASGPSCRYATIVPQGGVTTYLLGTSTGLYSTTNLNGSATTWVQEGANTIGNVVVPFLDSRVTDGLVVAGTHANGIYSATVGGGGGGGTTTTVYAGDANNNGVCDVLDILPIGRFFGLTGPGRTGGSTTWGAQTATIWTNADATYADCDGNGTVQATDVQAIIDNYGRTRSGINDRPETDKVKVCTELLREIDRQGTLSPAMKEIRGEVVRYMQQVLNITFDYELAQNYPNPFNPATTIRFTVPSLVPQADLTIFDLAGRTVWSKALTNVETGRHEVEWNGTSSSGEKVASGMYIYRFTSGNFSASKRMLMLK